MIALLIMFQVCPNCDVKVPDENGLFSSSASLELHLYYTHFSGGKLLLRCLAQIPDVYEESTQLLVGNLGSPTYQRGIQYNTDLLNPYLQIHKNFNFG